MWRIVLPIALISLSAAAPSRPAIVVQLKPSASVGEGSAIIPRDRYGHLSMVATIGTPGKDFSLALNTASKQTFVPLPGLEQATEHTTLYDPTKSSTSKIQKEQFMYKDGNITAYGRWYEDYMEVYPIDQKVRFAAIDELNGVATLYSDGQLGLAWTPHSDDEDKEPMAPLIRTMLKERPEKVYQLYTKPTHGSISIGRSGGHFCDQHPTVWLTLITGKIPTVLVTSFELGKYQYVSDHRAVFDSSISTIHMPEGPLSALLKLYNAKFDRKLGIYAADCSRNDHEWKITIDGKEFKITDKYALVDLHLGDGRCALMIDSSKFVANKQMFRFGLPFFHQYCVIGDVGNNRMGFSESVEA